MRGKSRARASEEFDAFYTGTAQRTVRTLVLLTGDLSEAEDVTHEAFERAWLHWSTVRECESPEAWVRTVARRLAVSRWRRTRNAAAAWLHRNELQFTPELDPTHVAIVTALRELPDKQRVAIVLHHLVDLPVDQVAQETGSSVSAVKKQLTRGRAALAVRLAEDDHSMSSPELPLGRAE